MDLSSPLAKAKGLGATRSGLHHWWLQRLTAVVLIPLGLWFMVSLLAITDATHKNVTFWLQQPIHTVFMLLFIAALFYHLALGVQIIIEDYVESKAGKIACLIVVNFIVWWAALTAILSLLKIFLT